MSWTQRILPWISRYMLRLIVMGVVILVPLSCAAWYVMWALQKQGQVVDYTGWNRNAGNRTWNDFGHRKRYVTYLDDTEIISMLNRAALLRQGEPFDQIEKSLGKPQFDTYEYMDNWLLPEFICRELIYYPVKAESLMASDKLDYLIDLQLDKSDRLFMCQLNIPDSLVQKSNMATVRSNLWKPYGYFVPRH